MPSPSPCSLGAVIRARRIALILTQEQLADRIGVRQSDVSRPERGCVELPRRQRLEAIATALEMPVGELLLQSRWYGADGALTATASPLTKRGERTSSVTPAEALAAVTGEPTLVSQLVAELRKATARAQETLATSEQLRSNVQTRWEQRGTMFETNNGGASPEDSEWHPTGE
jgi:transcriptional regulator with XRE-family HTH domain